MIAIPPSNRTLNDAATYSCWCGGDIFCHCVVQCKWERRRQKIGCHQYHTKRDLRLVLVMAEKKKNKKKRLRDDSKSPETLFKDAQRILLQGSDAASWKEAFDYFQSASEQGHARACLYLSHCYSEGWGTIINDAKAKECLEEASKRGDTLADDDPLAWYQLAMDLLERQSTDTDAKEAVAWLQKATDVGLPCAIYELASCYEDGRGVPEEDKELQD